MHISNTEFQILEDVIRCSGSEVLVHQFRVNDVAIIAEIAIKTVAGSCRIIAYALVGAIHLTKISIFSGIMTIFRRYIIAISLNDSCSRIIC